MAGKKIDYQQLNKEYSNPNSLSYKKIRIVNSYIQNGDSLLDIGMGTGENIAFLKNKFLNIYGIDPDYDSFCLCRDKFLYEHSIRIMHGDIYRYRKMFRDKSFDVITALDVLEHIPLHECNRTLHICHEMLKDDGLLIFSGPGFFEKIRIYLGLSPTHLHSHSPYGWERIITKAGFKIVTVETVEFPLVDCESFRKNLCFFGKCLIILARKRK